MDKNVNLANRSPVQTKSNQPPLMEMTAQQIQDYQNTVQVGSHLQSPQTSAQDKNLSTKHANGQQHSESRQSNAASQRNNMQRKRNKKLSTVAQGQGKTTGRWTDEEHQRFIEGIELYSKDWKKVTAHVGTRISAQVRSHAQKVLSDYSTGTKRGKKSDNDVSGEDQSCESSHDNLQEDYDSYQRQMSTGHKEKESQHIYQQLNPLKIDSRSERGTGNVPLMTPRFRMPYKEESDQVQIASELTNQLLNKRSFAQIQNDFVQPNKVNERSAVLIRQDQSNESYDLKRPKNGTQLIADKNTSRGHQHQHMNGSNSAQQNRLNTSNAESSEINDSSLRPHSDNSHEHVLPLKLKSQVSIDTLQRPHIKQQPYFAGAHANPLNINSTGQNNIQKLAANSGSNLLRPFMVPISERLAQEFDNKDKKLQALINTRLEISDLLYRNSNEFPLQIMELLEQLKNETVTLQNYVTELITDIQQGIAQIDGLGIYAAQFSTLARAMLARATILQVDVAHLFASFEDYAKFEQIRAVTQAGRQQNLTSLSSNQSDQALNKGSISSSLLRYNNKNMTGQEKINLNQILFQQSNPAHAGSNSTPPRVIVPKVIKAQQGGPSILSQNNVNHIEGQSQPEQNNQTKLPVNLAARPSSTGKVNSDALQQLWSILTKGGGCSTGSTDALIAANGRAPPAFNFLGANQTTGERFLMPHPPGTNVRGRSASHDSSVMSSYHSHK